MKIHLNYDQEEFLRNGNMYFNGRDTYYQNPLWYKDTGNMTYEIQSHPPGANTHTIQEALISLEESNEMVFIQIDSIENIKTDMENEGYEMEEWSNGYNNGWEVSFWLYFKHKTKKRLVLSGSLWYGSYKLEVADES